MRRRSRLSGLMEGFSQGYDTAGKLMQDYEMAKIAKAEPTQEVQPVMAEVDPTGADPGATNGSKTVTKFLGQTVDGPMDPSAVSSARMSAMAGVMKKYNPMEGLRLEQQAMQGQRDSYRFGREQKRDAEDDKRRESENVFLKESQEAYKGSRFATINTEHEKAVSEYQKSLDEYEKRKLSGVTGPALGVAPQAPQKPAYSATDSLLDHAKFLDVKLRHNKAAPEEVVKFGQMMKTVQDEGYEQALKLAQGGAPIADVAKAFNASGKAQLDPAAVVSDRVIKGKDGVESRVIQIRDATGGLRTINTVAELDALGKAKDIFDRAFKRADDVRADATLAENIRSNKVREGQAGAGIGMRQAEISKAEAEKKAQADAAAGIFLEQNPGASQAQIEAVRRGVMPAIPQRGEIKSEFKPDQYGGSGTAVQTDRAGNIVVTKVDSKGQPVGTSTIPAPGASVQRPTVAPPAAAIDMLKKNPALAAHFDAKYGKGAAAAYLK